MSPEVPESPKELCPLTVKPLGCTTGQALSAALGLGSAGVHTGEVLGQPLCARPLPRGKVKKVKFSESSFLTNLLLLYLTPWCIRTVREVASNTWMSLGGYQV